MAESDAAVALAMQACIGGHQKWILHDSTQGSFQQSDGATRFA